MSDRHNRIYLGESLLIGARPYLLIILIGLALYSASAFFGLSYLDDNILILENHDFISKLSNIPAAFKQDVFHVLHEYDAAYRPLLTISFMFDTFFDRLLGLGYHFTNIILHLIQSCLVFLLFLKLRYSRSLAFSLALIFTVHPALTQTVAWIPGRNDSLLGIFALASFISLIEFLERPSRANCARHIIFLTLALFTKESAPAILIVSLFYYSFIFRGKLLSTEQKALFAGWLGALALWLVFRGLALSHNPASISGIAVLRDLALAAPAFFIYAGKAIFPFGLSIIPTIEDSSLVYGIAALSIIALGLYLSKNKRKSFMLLGLVWFLSFLAPTFIRAAPGESAVFFESRMYLPILGIFIILSEIDIVKNISLKNTRTLLVVLASATVLFYTSADYASHFQNAESFWVHAVKKSPHSALAQYNLGWVRYMQMRYGEAKERFGEALKLNPRQRYAHNSLGCIYELEGQLEKAEAEYMAEIENTPYYEAARVNLANLHKRQKKI